MSAVYARSVYIHSHWIALHAIEKVGHTLLAEHPNSDGWSDRLSPLAGIDWRRSNTALWEGRALIGGRVSKSTNNVVLTTNVLRGALGQTLTPEEQRVEDAYTKGRE